MAFNTITSCGADCTDFLLPALPSDPNCISGYAKSEIKHLLIRPRLANGTLADNPFDTTWGTGATGVALAVTAANIDNTIVDNSKTHHMKGIGNIGDADVATQLIHDDVEVVVNRAYELSFVVKTLDDLTYAYLMKLQCNRSDSLNFYYGTEPHILGIADGLVPNFINVNFAYSEGKTEVVSATIVLRWDANSEAERRNNPLT